MANTWSPAKPTFIKKDVIGEKTQTNGTKIILKEEKKLQEKPLAR